MDVLAVISPGLKLLLERFGKPVIVNRPDFFQFDPTGAVIVCNHVGWFDSLWIAHAVYPRQLRYARSACKRHIFFVDLWSE